MTSTSRSRLCGAALATVCLVASACGGSTNSSTTGTGTATTLEGTGLPTTTTGSDTVTSNTATTTDSATSDEIEERLSQDLASGKTMAELLEDEVVPGVTLAIVRDGEIIYTGAFGIDPRTRRPLEEHAVFQVGSIAKPVTAIGAAWLAQARVLFWDIDVDELLTSYKLPRGSVSRSEAITVERLVSHRGGVNVASFPGYASDEPIPTLAEVLSGDGNTPGIRANRPVGEYWYSGGGYTVLEQVMIDATGRPFLELMDDIVFKPAGMVESTFRTPVPQRMRGQVSAPSVDGRTVTARVYPEHAAAGLWSTSPDLARLVLAYQGALAGEENGLLAQPWAERLIGFSSTDSFDITVGHGWYLDRPEDPQWFWHIGTNVGYNAEVIGSIDGRHGAVVLTNAFDAKNAIADILATIGDIEGWEGSPR